MTPIEKNVIVVDESGNEYGATYPKRARGLVKSGRARFIDENRICLACPPQNENKTEDIKMSENMNIEANETVETTEIAEVTEAVETAENTATKYTIDYVLEQIAKLHADKEFYSAITNEFKSVMAVNSDSFAAAESAQAIGKAIMCRETTNQQLIAFYEKMYDDLKPASKANKLATITLLLKALSECVNDSAACYMADELRRLMED